MQLSEKRPWKLPFLTIEMKRLNACQDKSGCSSYINKDKITLLVYLGNPILKNDCIGIKIGSRLENDLINRRDIEVCEFVGSPLDLVTQFKGYKRIVLIDSIISGTLDIGSVVIFNDDEILSRSGNPHYIHGVNLSEALALSRRLGIPLPSEIFLIGIEIGKADEFGDTLSDDLNCKMDDIYHNIYDIISRFSRN
jgi:hydrogenase maturation protease